MFGCGLTLDLTPADDAGTADARRDAPVIDANTPDVASDSPRDAMRRDVSPECLFDDDCFLPDCVIRSCIDGMCVDGPSIACAPMDACHFWTGACLRDGSCEFGFIDEDGDGFAPVELGSCGLDCDDTNPDRVLGGVCALDLDGDGFGNPDEFEAFCGDITCEGGLVDNIDDCWDEERDGVEPGTPDPLLANPDQLNFFEFPRADGTGSFDWDCDGVETSNTGEEVFTGCSGRDEPPGACVAQSGWQSFVPACADEAPWVACLPNGSRACTSAMRLRQKFCR